jgi:hypothetical protein
MKTACCLLLKVSRLAHYSYLKMKVVGSSEPSFPSALHGVTAQNCEIQCRKNLEHNFTLSSVSASYWRTVSLSVEIRVKTSRDFSWLFRNCNRFLLQMVHILLKVGSRLRNTKRPTLNVCLSLSASSHFSTFSLLRISFREQAPSIKAQSSQYEHDQKRK